jgi:hypothetical protein
MRATTRRDFIKSVGIATASLVMARCIPFGGKDDSPRGRLRNCWLRLDWLAQQTQEDFERGDQALDELVADHRTALNDLVAAGELGVAVADQMQVAFTEAAHHVWRSNAPITCYEAVMMDYTPASSGQLTQQADLLAEMAKGGDLDPATVAQAQAAIERDIAFLNLSDAETQTLYDELIAAAGDTYDFPSFDELDLEVTLEAAEAARFLVNLLLRRTE